MRLTGQTLLVAAVVALVATAERERPTQLTQLNSGAEGSAERGTAPHAGASAPEVRPTFGATIVSRVSPLPEVAFHTVTPEPGFSPLAGMDWDVTWGSQDTRTGRSATGHSVAAASSPGHSGDTAAVVAIVAGLALAARRVHRLRKQQQGGAVARDEEDPAANAGDDGFPAPDGAAGAAPKEAVTGPTADGVRLRSSDRAPQRRDGFRAATSARGPLPSASARTARAASAAASGASSPRPGLRGQTTATPDTSPLPGPRPVALLDRTTGSGERLDRSGASSRVQLFVRPDWQRR